MQPRGSHFGDPARLDSELRQKKNSAADALFLSLFDASLRRSAHSRVFAKVPELAEAKNKGGGPPPQPSPPLSLPTEEDFAEVTCLVLVAACESSCIPLPRFISPDPDSSGAAMGTMCVGIWILLVALHIQGKISDTPPRTYTLPHFSRVSSSAFMSSPTLKGVFFCCVETKIHA